MLFECILMATEVQNTCTQKSGEWAIENLKFSLTFLFFSIKVSIWQTNTEYDLLNQFLYLWRNIDFSYVYCNGSEYVLQKKISFFCHNSKPHKLISCLICYTKDLIQFQTLSSFSWFQMQFFSVSIQTDSSTLNMTLSPFIVKEVTVHLY